jgi:hypothetical protein
MVEQIKDNMDVAGAFDLESQRGPMKMTVY